MKSDKPERFRPRFLSCTHGQSEASGPQPFLPDLKMPWEEYYRCQTERLSRIAAVMRVPRDQITDVLQEVWVAAVDHQKEFRGADTEQRLFSWLVGVVRKKSIDVIRRLRRLRKLRIESLDDLSAGPVDCNVQEPADGMEAMERYESVYAKLEELRKKNPLNYRLIREHGLEGRSLSDLAAETGMSVNAISCRISRALQYLRSWLQEWYPAANAAGRHAPRVGKRRK
jgi:RNA polymerase sigma factor (sigma-70 family)